MPEWVLKFGFTSRMWLEYRRSRNNCDPHSALRATLTQRERDSSYVDPLFHLVEGIAKRRVRVEFTTSPLRQRAPSSTDGERTLSLRPWRHEAHGSSIVR